VGKQTAMLVKNIRLKGALLFALIMLVFPASAQQTTKKAPPTKTAPGVVDSFGFDDPQHAGQNLLPRWRHDSARVSAKESRRGDQADTAGRENPNLLPAIQFCREND